MDGRANGMGRRFLPFNSIALHAAFSYHHHHHLVLVASASQLALLSTLAVAVCVACIQSLAQLIDQLCAKCKPNLIELIISEEDRAV